MENLLAQSRDANGAPHIDRACIIGLDGGAPWTTPGHANGLKLHGQESAVIAKCLKLKDFTSFMTNGVRVEGVMYTFLREMDEKIVLAKHKGHGAVTFQASKTAVVIGHCPEGSQHGNCNKAVGIVAEYLESLGM